MKVRELAESIERARAEAEKAVNPHERNAYLKIQRLFERLLSMRRAAGQAEAHQAEAQLGPTQVEPQLGQPSQIQTHIGELPSKPR